MHNFGINNLFNFFEDEFNQTLVKTYKCEISGYCWDVRALDNSDIILADISHEYDDNVGWKSKIEIQVAVNKDGKIIPDYQNKDITFEKLEFEASIFTKVSGESIGIIKSTEILEDLKKNKKGNKFIIVLLVILILLIIGGGDVLPLLKKKVEENHWDDRVRFYPRMPYRDMMAITRLAEIGFTLDKANNLNYLFSLPNKLFDYIQANVPIIASHLPEIERIIRDYNIGTFVVDHNPQHIAEKIKETLSDENALKTWKNNLNFAAQELCWENEEQTLIKIYEQYI